MRLHLFALCFSIFIFPTLAYAQSFDGKYDGKMILTKGGDDCGAKSDVFLLEATGKTVRIRSQRGEKPFEGTIQSDGQFFASGPARGRNITLEWRGQILATKTGLGTALLKGDNICQFLLSLKRN